MLLRSAVRASLGRRDREARVCPALQRRVGRVQARSELGDQEVRSRGVPLLARRATPPPTASTAPTGPPPAPASPSPGARVKPSSRRSLHAPRSKWAPSSYSSCSCSACSSSTPPSDPSAEVRDSGSAQSHRVRVCGAARWCTTRHRTRTRTRPHRHAPQSAHHAARLSITCAVLHAQGLRAPRHAPAHAEKRRK